VDLRSIGSPVIGDVNRRDPGIGSSNQIEIDGWTWTIIASWILLATALLRLYNLDLKPLHHDEGVNALFVTNLVRIAGT